MVCSVTIAVEVYAEPRKVSDSLRSVRVFRRRADANGDERVDWYSLSLRGKRWVEYLDALNPGVRVLVCGTMEQRTFPHRETGTLVTVVDLVPLQPLQFL